MIVHDLCHSNTVHLALDRILVSDVIGVEVITIIIAVLSVLSI